VRPNHKDDCDGSGAYFSGEGYNRVRVCGCGAEDHAPEHRKHRCLTNGNCAGWLPVDGVCDYCGGTVDQS
jgi:hypothetical protein